MSEQTNYDVVLTTRLSETTNLGDSSFIDPLAVEADSINNPPLSDQIIEAARVLLQTSISSGQPFKVSTLPVKLMGQSLSTLAFSTKILSAKLMDISSAKLADSAIINLQSANIIQTPQQTASPSRKTNEFKIKRLNELQIEIDKCSAAMYLMPDADVNARVDLVAKNPCIDSIYYLNAMYNKEQIISSEIEAKKYRQTVNKIIRYDIDAKTASDNQTYLNLVNQLTFNDNIGFGVVVKDNGLQVKDEILFASHSLSALTNFVSSQWKKINNSSSNTSFFDIANLANRLNVGSQRNRDFDEYGYSINILVNPLLNFYGEQVRQETDPNFAEYLALKESTRKQVLEARINEQKEIEAAQNKKIEDKRNEYEKIRADYVTKGNIIANFREDLEGLYIELHDYPDDQDLIQDIFQLEANIKSINAEAERLNEQVVILNHELEEIIAEVNKQRNAQQQTVNVLPDFVDPAFIVETDNFKIFEQRLATEYDGFTQEITQFLKNIKNPELLQNSDGSPKFNTKILNFTKFQNARKTLINNFITANQLMFLPNYLKGWDMTFIVGPKFVEVKYDFKNLDKNKLLPVLSTKITEIEEDPACPKYVRDFIPKFEADTFLNDILTSR